MHKKTVLVFVALVLLSLCSCIGYELYYLWEIDHNFGHDQPSFVPNPESPYSYDYEFNPETILVSLDREETAIFVPTIATPEVYVPLSAGSFPWTQADYLKIASAFEQIEWNENLDEWHVRGMNFDRDCGANSKGFDSGKIIYFKFDTAEGTPDYLRYRTVTLAIYPLYKSLAFGKSSFPRPLLGWKTINMNRLTVTAEDALRIAEEHGGKESRLSVNNECEISVILNPSYLESWEVRYNATSFDMQIDPYTGRYKIINSGEQFNHTIYNNSYAPRDNYWR